MSTFTNINDVCTSIHNLIQSSGLHYVINQTPWSSYITIRKKFVRPHHGGTSNEEVVIDKHETREQTLVKKNKILEQKLVDLKLELSNKEEESKVAKEVNEKLVENLHSRVSELEDSLEIVECDQRNKKAVIKTLEKESKSKDEIIKRMNCGFNEKITELTSKVKESETRKKEINQTKEKNTRKKIDKKTGCTDDKTADKSENNVGTVDKNQNILEKPIKFIQKPNGLSGTNSDLSTCSSYLSPARRCAPVSRPPCSPQSPHTPPGLPPSDSFHSEPQCEASLSGYFTNPAPARDQEGKGSTDSGPVLTADYIKNIGKICLIPRGPIKDFN